ncbi:MAG: cache domain-containing protein [Cyanobacteria bacterium P01_C01_bin.118]
MNPLKDVFISHNCFDRYELPPTRLIALLVTSIIPLGLIGWLSLRNSQQAATDLALELSQQMHQTIQQTIEKDIEQSYSFSRSVAIASKYGVLDINDSEALQAYIWQQFRMADTAIENVYVGTEKGDFVHFGIDGEKFKLELMDDQTDGQRISYVVDARGERMAQTVKHQDDPRVRPWYRSTMFPEPASFSAPYFSGNSQQLGFTLAEPIYNSASEFQGVAAVDVSLIPLQQKLKAMDEAMAVDIALLEVSGDLLATSSKSPLVLANNVGVRVQAADSENMAIAMATQALVERLTSLEAINSQTVLTLKVYDQTYIIHANPIGRELGLNWLMLSLVPQAELLETVQANARITAAVVAIAVLLSGGLGIYAYRQTKLSSDF